MGLAFDFAHQGFGEPYQRAPKQNRIRKHHKMQLRITEIVHRAQKRLNKHREIRSLPGFVNMTGIFKRRADITKQSHMIGTDCNAVRQIVSRQHRISADNYSGQNKNYHNSHCKQRQQFVCIFKKFFHLPVP